MFNVLKNHNTKYKLRKFLEKHKNKSPTSICDGNYSNEIIIR